MGNSIFAKLILLLCVSMQVVAVLPHHHHGESVHLCLDAGHAVVDEEPGGLSVAHLPHSRSYAVCASHGIVMARPEFRDDAVREAVTDHFPGCCCPCCFSDVAAFISENRVEAFLNGYSRQSDPEPFLRTYLTDALPCRAPDFMG